jgi:hypothetical protein
MRTLRLALAAIAAAILLLPGVALAAGPPFPDPVANQAVYDTAGAFRADTIARVEAAIDMVEADTGAEVVVYTQLVPDSITHDQAESHAKALMDQWGVGRAGVNDGLVILFDLKQSDRCHGQVDLYGGKGYNDAWLSVDDRQRIFDDDMVPKLRTCDLDGALLAAMNKVSGVQTGRVVNAVIGLVLAPLVLLLLVGGSLLRWYLAGRDPVYLDDPSILMPAPPPGLTPAAGAVVRDGSTSRRALTAASLDLAARGRIAFQASQAPGLHVGSKPQLGIFTRDSQSQDPVEQARLARVRARPLDDATAFLMKRLAVHGGGDGYIPPGDTLSIGRDVGGFDSRIEKHVVTEGWFTDEPAKVAGRWSGRGVLAFIGGIAGLIGGFNLPSSGVVLLGGALLLGSFWLFGIAGAMPARTKDGAVIRAMLEAYRRTLEKTMAQSRSMGEVVEQSAIPLIENPDDAVVWGVALGLQDEVEGVLQRSAEDLSTGRSITPYMPLWYSAGSAWGGGGGGGGWAPGVLSSSPIPDFGGMMTALGTIGNSPASSGSGGGGGGGGFSGGSSGGGGGAGGGF